MGSRILTVTDAIDQAQALQALRLEIDELDQALLTLLNRRAKCALEVAAVKEQSADNEPAIFYRPEREAQVLRGLVEKNFGPLSHEKVALIFRQVMSACLALEEPMQVAFLGPEGTFTQQATLKHFGDAVIGRPFVTVDEVFREVAAENCHYGVVPVENSTEGVVNHTLDNFLTSSLRICGECELKVHHHFMALTTDAPIERIYAHQQTFGQCRRWLDVHYPDAVRIDASSNAQAAKLVSRDPGAGAIASEVAADLYGLTILSRKIEDLSDNTTRFLVVGREPVGPSGADKTSIMVSTQNRPGALFSLLEPFHRHGISLTAIETRPSKQGMWSYVFFIDFDGHITEPDIQAVLDEVSKDALEVKILGSYPRALRL